MKPITRFLVIAISLVSFGAHASPVPTTVGSNLTAYNSGSGALNNNTWATATNSRSNGVANAPKADFGNCNSLILRCAQPKCTGGGCADMTVASTIVNGCVQSSDVCKKHGADLVNYIAAQLVADSAAAANAAQSAAATAAANAAAQQSAQQLQAMQAQMQQMQADMAAQNQAQMQQMQAALNEQKQIAAAAQAQAAAQATAAAEAKAAAVSSGAELSDAQRIAAESGVSQDLLVREQATGEIMTSIENAETKLKNLEIAMDRVFEYAGCDDRGNSCEGPKRVDKFRDLAKEFFSPYETVTDEIYDALIEAMSVGVDMTDVMMLLNNSCNRWGEYWCKKGQEPTYTDYTCQNGRSVGRKTWDSKGEYWSGPFDGQPCKSGGMIPESNNGCRLIKLYADNTDVSRVALWGEEEEGTNGDHMRVACASDILFSNSMFSRKAKPAAIEIDTLQRIVTQDEGRVSRSNRRNNDDDGVNDAYKFCAIDDDGYGRLQEYVARRSLPTKRLCINEDRLDRDAGNMVPIIDSMGGSLAEVARENCMKQNKDAIFSEITRGCYCEQAVNEKNEKLRWDAAKNQSTSEVVDANQTGEAERVANLPKLCDQAKTIKKFQSAHRIKCRSYGDAEWSAENVTQYTDSKQNHFGECDCNGTDNDNNPNDIANCTEMFQYGYTITDGAGGGNEHSSSIKPVAAPSTSTTSTTTAPSSVSTSGSGTVNLLPNLGANLLGNYSLGQPNTNSGIPSFSQQLEAKKKLTGSYF